MTLQKIEFEYDIPDGYRFVRYGMPKKGDECLVNNKQIIVAEYDYDYDCIIVEKIPEQEQSIQNQKRHKHADLIHAWAEGAEIQYYNNVLKKWVETVHNDPSWRNNVDYRIKPKTKTIRFRNWYHTNGRVYASHSQCEENGPDFVKWLGDWQEVEVEEND